MGTGWRLVVVGLALGALAGCSQAMRPPAPVDPNQAETGSGAEDVARMTGSVSSVQLTPADRRRYTDMRQLLQGRVAGLEFIRDISGKYSLRLIGTASPSGSNEPLVVIDGMQVQPADVTNALAAVTPDIVDRVDVLKDAGSAALYGIRGANGVIVITTLRGPDRGW